MNWKKFFAALLAVCLAVSCLCMNAVAVVEDPVDPIKQLEMQPNSDSAPTASPTEIPAPSSNPDGTVGEPDSTPTPDPSPSSTPSATPIPTSTPTPLPTAPVPPTGSTGNTGTDSDFSIGGGVTDTDGNATTRDATTTEAHGEIANAIANGTWGEEYTTCEKCGKHDWWKLSDGTFKCKNCSYMTTGVKETSNVTPLDEGNRSGTAIITNASGKEVEQVVVTGIVKEEEGKSTNSVTVETVKDSEGKVTSVKSELEVPGKNSGGTSSVGVNSIPAVAKGFLTEEEMAEYRSNGANYLVFAKDYKDPEPLKVSAAYSFVKIVPEITQSRNPVQAAADKRELTYLNSVLAYQIANAQKEQQYIASVQQQQLAAVQREDAYAEMVLTAAAKLQQEADQREAAYLQSVRAAQVTAQKQLMTESELTVKTPSIQKALIVY